MSDRVLEEIAALKDEDWALREEAATLLGEFRDPRAVGPLVEALHDEDRAVREAATTALRKIGPPAAPALIVALQDPNGNVQEAAVAILKDVATPEAVGPLRSEEHTSVIQATCYLVCRLLLSKKIRVIFCSSTRFPASPLPRV